MPLYLVRHGQTDWNRQKRFQSRTDVPLNETGLGQARAMREEFAKRGLEFSLARCSPLGRAQITAQIILEGSATELVVEPLFIELEFGGFEGEFEADLKERYGADFDIWRESQYTLTPPAGGENIIDGAERVRPALEKIIPSAVDGNVLLVAHQAVNMAIKVAISGKTDVASAATYRQNNDEIDVWDVVHKVRIEQFKLAE